ncbi:MAG: MerR family transcriptional regulator [Bacteroidetes bacterium]|jgi:DNA-binding transcriptional MerR regulator|nr:MerR family transcriptional regulator [Bacteroidota bacterium]
MAHTDPNQDEEIRRRYYSIAEAADLLGVNQSVIRFWEKEFDYLTPRKNRAGRRQYTADDLERLRTIYHLMREKKYTLEGARAALKRQEPLATESLPEETPTVAPSAHAAATLQTLQRLRDFLVQMRKSLPE